ncbi:SusD/RagB family nutrient-binding outer membrane lipoprotein [Bergeyella sp. RCAD1439]|uniref:SusD/RagB family nutrient-binding outer membrane lipoprotein n=1 Tax=Bergeyella anatis TaxID=3113737 RepID=UPI002E18AEF0|nr:SusD/RagB family nutrient-binding outer membrane lipoprotein [Bergeyella sp. RCAD1439]
MKNLKTSIIKYAIALGVVATGFSVQSCSDELNINVDPNNPQTVPLRTLMTGSQVNLGYALGGEGTRMPASIMQYYAGHRGQPYSYAIYNITSASTDGTWQYLYDAAMDFNEIEKRGTASGDLVYVGVAQIMKAYTFSVITDLFGDIPYTDAMKGRENITPTYDTQEAIYTDLIKVIDKGIANIKTDEGLFKPSESDDIIFAGNVLKWERFANSLKLRLYNHLSKRQPNAASDFLAQNPLLIETSANDAKVGFGDTNASANPIYQFDKISGRADFAVATTIVDKMKALDDPRVSVYFEPIKNNGAGLAGQVIGNEPGGDTDDAGQNLYSRVGSAYASINSPVVLMSAAEVNFIKAEVYLAQGNSAAAKTAYENAIAQDFAALGLTGSYSSYVSEPSVAFDGTLQRVMEQKWITMFQAPFESWVDWRRTGYPVLQLPKVVRTDDFVPRRLPYPQIEINVNGTNLAAGPGVPLPFKSMATKMWWDQ